MKKMCHQFINFLLKNYISNDSDFALVGQSILKFHSEGPYIVKSEYQDSESGKTIENTVLGGLKYCFMENFTFFLYSFGTPNFIPIVPYAPKPYF